MSDHFKQFERSKTSIISWYAFVEVLSLILLWYFLGVVAQASVVVLGIWLALLAIEELIFIGLALQNNEGTLRLCDYGDINIWIITRIVELFTVTFLVANTVGVWGLFLAFGWLVWILIRITPFAWLMTLGE